MELIRKSNEPINSELWFEIFFYLINTKKIEFSFIKRPTGYNPSYFWIVTVHDWSKTSPDNVFCQLLTLNFSSVTDINILLFKKLKINAAFLIINE